MRLGTVTAGDLDVMNPLGTQLMHDRRSRGLQVGFPGAWFNCFGDMMVGGIANGRTMFEAHDLIFILHGTSAIMRDKHLVTPEKRLFQLKIR